MDDGSLIVLGSGTSVGVPVLGCECPVCVGGHPRNQRTRTSVVLQFPEGNLLIDTTPEMRLQLLREKVPIVHAVVYTHYHVDHLYGLDDLRVFPKILGHSLPIFCTAEVEEVIRNVFGYAFQPGAEQLPAGMLPKLEFRRITDHPFEVFGRRIVPIPLKHGRFDCLGFRIGNVAYCTDVNAIPATSWPLLEELDVLILDCLKPGKSHPSHFGLDEVLQVVERLQPKRTYLTHLSHMFDAGNLPPLPRNVELAYDGMRIPLGRTP